ncbi:hypothetical protein SEA_GENEVAB15_114 [Mycobacterium phage GenevaB15]|nr:hypothetical protein SEA_GENEVAB15_114 [Mycobacterium phage GenevaB15]
MWIVPTLLRVNAYKCSACKRPVGLMVDAKGEPEMFKCPNTGRVASATK